MTTIIIEGVDETVTKSNVGLDEINKIINVSSHYSIAFALTRDARTDKTINNIKGDDILLLEFEDGIRLWTRVDQFEQDFPVTKARGTDSGTLTIPRKLPIAIDDSTRGGSEWMLKTLNIFGIDPVSETAIGIGKLVEKQLDQTPGLYQCVTEMSPDNTEQTLKLIQPEEKLDGSKPILLFIHGTASSSAGSFGELWRDSSHEYLSQLHAYFGKHIYAFEHRSLSESPIKNTIDLVKALNEHVDQSKPGKPLQIHMVSHSRGGLVGELIARVDVGEHEQTISETEIEQYAKAGSDYSYQVEQLRELSKLLDARFATGAAKGLRKFTVHRFVRTACPAGGQR